MSLIKFYKKIELAVTNNAKAVPISTDLLLFLQEHIQKLEQQLSDTQSLCELTEQLRRKQMQEHSNEIDSILAANGVGRRLTEDGTYEMFFIR